MCSITLVGAGGGLRSVCIAAMEAGGERGWMEEGPADGGISVCLDMVGGDCAMVAGGCGGGGEAERRADLGGAGGATVALRTGTSSEARAS